VGILKWLHHFVDVFDYSSAVSKLDIIMSVRAELWGKQMSRAPVRPYPRSTYLIEGTLRLVDPLPALSVHSPSLEVGYLMQLLL
jgi:hypothetical protein